jgi:hypothetical protein
MTQRTTKSPSNLALSGDKKRNTYAIGTRENFKEYIESSK